MAASLLLEKGKQRSVPGSAPGHQYLDVLEWCTSELGSMRLEIRKKFVIMMGGGQTLEQASSGGWCPMSI